MSREFIPLVRASSTKSIEKFFILAYEGNVTEVKYFKNFQSSSCFNNSGAIKVVSLKKNKNTGSDPISIKKLLKEAKESQGFKKTDEFWIVCDRDHWETIHKIDFDKLLKDCESEGNFFIAMSNPCFEIWLYLHLDNLDSLSDEERQLFLDNEKISSKKNYLDKILAEKSGRPYNKKPCPTIFSPRIKEAVSRAKTLDSDGEQLPKSLGSHVYKLIEKLID